MVLVSFAAFECYSAPACCCDSRGDAADNDAVQSQAYANVGECAFGEDIECLHESLALGLFNADAAVAAWRGATCATQRPPGDRRARQCAVGGGSLAAQDRGGVRGGSRDQASAESCAGAQRTPSVESQADLGQEELDEGQKAVEVAQSTYSRACTPSKDVGAGSALSESPVADNVCARSPGVVSVDIESSFSVAAESVQRPWVPGSPSVTPLRPGSTSSGEAVTPSAQVGRLAPSGGAAFTASSPPSAAVAKGIVSPFRRPSSDMEEELLDVSDLRDSPAGYMERFSGFHEVGTLDDDDDFKV